MKTIITHLSPDLDAISSTWLIKKYLKGWKNSLIKLVPAGTTLNNSDPDVDLNIIYVDTGLGKFDHHQTDQYISASDLIFNHLKNNSLIPSKDIEPLSRMIELITFIDHFQEATLENASDDIYDSCFHQLIDGIKIIYSEDKDRQFDIFFELLESLFINIKNKIIAEKDLKKGFIFHSRWGKSIAVETKIENCNKVAIKMGYDLVIRRNPQRNYLKVSLHPNSKLSLKPIYQLLKEKCPQASWYLHSSNKLLFDGNNKNPKFVPSNLSLKQIIAIVEKI